MQNHHFPQADSSMKGLQHMQMFTSRAVWWWPRTALCSGVSPSLARKSIWAPPSTRTRMASPPPGSHCTARVRGVSKEHTQRHTYAALFKWDCYRAGSSQLICWRTVALSKLLRQKQTFKKKHLMHFSFYGYDLTIEWRVRWKRVCAS